MSYIELTLRNQPVIAHFCYDPGQRQTSDDPAIPASIEIEQVCRLDGTEISDVTSTEFADLEEAILRSDDHLDLP